MATITGLTSAKMLALSDANIVGGSVNGLGNLILTTRGGSTIDAGPITAAGLISQYRRGDNTWATLDKTAVGLGLVDNVSVLSDFFPKWKGSTQYFAGNLVLSPFGEEVRAKFAHISGTSYVPANWASIALGETVVRTNYITNGRAEVDTAGWAAENGATFTRDTSAPISGLASFKHATGGDAYLNPSPAAAVGDYWTLSADYKTSGTVTGTPKLYLGQLGGSTPSASQALPLTQISPTRFSVTLGPFTTGATNVIASLFAPTTGGVVWFDNILLEKTATPPGAAGSFYDGASTADEIIFAWSGAANASTSTATYTPNTAFVAKWKASKAYTSGDQVVNPRGEIVTSKTTRTAGSSYNATEAANWASVDQVMSFTNGGFAWSANTAWDAGTLSADASSAASSQVTPGAAFASAGSLSGTIKFLEPGIYDVIWDNAPGAEPGAAGYRIVSSGTWPGPLDTPNGIFAQGIHMSGQFYWETKTHAVGLRVPQANLEIRMVGQQGNATTNTPRIRVIKRASI